MRKILSFILALTLIFPCISMITIDATSEITGIIEGASLNLGSTLTIDYFATLSERADEVQMQFVSSSGRETTVSGIYDSQIKMYKFSYTGINPQCMTDTIDAKLILNGTILANHEDYSVALYCNRQINKTADELGYTSFQLEKFKTLLADMLEYGAQSQLYKKYRTDSLANNYSWLTDYKSVFNTPIGVREINGNSDPENRVKSLGVHLANVNNLYFKLILNDETVKIYVNDAEIERSELSKNTDGTYTYYTSDLKATEFDKVFTIKLIKDNNIISTVSYNVYAYIQSKYNADGVGDITKALYNYGKSAKEYVKSISNNDSNFDLEDNDIIGSPANTEIIDTVNSTFEGINFIDNTAWTDLDDASDSIKLSLRNENNNQFLVASVSENAANYLSPLFDIMPFIKRSGEYTISFKYKITSRDTDKVLSPFTPLIRTKSETSFSSNNNGNFYLNLSSVNDANNNV